MIPVSPGCRQPLLAVPYGPRSAPAWQIAEAASGLCDLLWLIDERDTEIAFTARLLRKVGTVVNLGGLSPREAAQLVREHSPDGVVVLSEDDILPLALMAEELGLEYHTPQVARRLVDKLLQREAFRDWGMPSPLCWEIPIDRDPAAIEALAAKVEFPVVLKPRTGSGSSYTTLVAGPADLVRAVADLPPQAGGVTGMCIEQYLPSVEKGWNEHFDSYVSVESLVAGGHISHLAVTGRFPMAEPFRETGFFVPSDLPQAELAGVLGVATAALQALGVMTGGCHTEIKLTPDGPRVIEVNGRLGGGVSEMLSQAGGVSLVQLSMRVALGEPLVVENLIPCSRVGWLFEFQPPTTARRVVSIEGLDRLAELTGVQTVFVNRSPGDSVDWREGGGHFIYSVAGVCENYDGLLEINAFLHEEVSIAYE